MKFCPMCQASMEIRSVDGEERLACASACGFVHWDNPTPVVAVVVETDDGIVLAHNRLWPQGMFSIITGFLERGETPEQCALRETQEELGLTGTQADFIGFELFDGRGVNGHEYNQLIIGFYVRVSGDIRLDENELDEYKVIPRDRLKGWNSATGKIVTRWLTTLEN